MSGAAAAAAGRVWLFDLDNTLHDARPHIFPRINRAMSSYIERHLGLDAAAAAELRATYWQRYGATLSGLVRHHGTDPGHFLRETHRFDDLASLIVGQPGILAALKRLPGRKLVFSNAPHAYACAVLRHLGIIRQFDAVYSLEKLRFNAKPALAGFLHLLRRERLRPQDCVMVEDTLANLVAAKKLGMKTVLVSAGLRRSPCVDVQLPTITDLPRYLRWL